LVFVPHDSVSVILPLRFKTTMSRKAIRRPKRSKLRGFLIYLVLLLMMLGLLARPLAKGALFYQSYWGGAVFVPFLLLIIAIFVVAVVVNLNRNKNP
jgi:hypothetical protein